MLESQKKTMEETVRAVEESTRRKALDEFLADVRTEERHYLRENKMLFMNRKSLVLQERIFFRNIPLSNWVEHEMVVEEGADVDKRCSIRIRTDLTGNACRHRAVMGWRSPG